MAGISTGLFTLLNFSAPTIPRSEGFIQVTVVMYIIALISACVIESNDDLTQKEKLKNRKNNASVTNHTECNNDIANDTK